MESFEGDEYIYVRNIYNLSIYVYLNVEYTLVPSCEIGRLKIWTLENLLIITECHLFFPNIIRSCLKTLFKLRLIIAKCY